MLKKLKNWFLHHFSLEKKLSWKRVVVALLTIIGGIAVVGVMFLWIWNRVERSKWERTAPLSSIANLSSAKGILALRLQAFREGQEYQKTRSMTVQEAPSPSAEPEKQPTEQAAALKIAKSPGIFFPTADGAIINNNRPTIIANVPGYIPYLKSRVVEKKSVISGETRWVREYLPGRVQKLNVYLDGKPLSPIFGVAQQPEVECSSQEGVDKYCGITKSDNPNLLVFAKPEDDLSIGKHTVEVIGSMNIDDSYSENYGRITFFVYPGYEYGLQTIPLVKNLSDQNRLFRTDNCPQGWYYDKSVLKMPIPHLSNNKLIYQISFLKTIGGKTTDDTIAQIGFENYKYDLFVPGYEYIFGQQERVGEMYELFLPVANLFFPNGTRIPVNKESGMVGPFEIFTRDYGGGVYFDSAMPWTQGHDSSCDG